MHTSVRDTPKSVSCQVAKISTDVCLSLYINSGIYGGVGKLICENIFSKVMLKKDVCCLLYQFVYSLVIEPMTLALLQYLCFIPLELQKCNLN